MTLHPLVAQSLREQLAGGWRPRNQLSVEQARAQLAARPAEPAPPTLPVPCEVTDENLPGEIPARRYRPVSAPARAGFVFLHGGGWVLGDLDLSDRFCRDLAVRAGCEVISVGYRLAPEHPYPAALEDTVAAVGDTLRRHPGRPLAVGGISAGGNLAAAACLWLRDHGQPMPALQVLICPALDMTCATASYRDFAEGYYLTAADMRWFWDHYRGGQEDGNGWLSPSSAASLAGLSPALVIGAEYDVLRDEGEAYAARLNDAGVEATSVRFGGMIHGFVGDRRLPAARSATALVCAALSALA